MNTQNIWQEYARACGAKSSRFEPDGYLTFSPASLRDFVAAIQDREKNAVPERKPLTREEIISAQRAVDPEGFDLCGWSFTEGIRWAEKHHGIKGDA